MSLATETVYRTILKVNATHCNGTDALLLTKYLCTYKSYINFVIDPPLIVAQSRAESTCTWEINNHGKYINQFPPNIIKSIRQYERINKKIRRQKMSIMFKEICINEEILPKYTYIYIYIYI